MKTIPMILAATFLATTMTAAVTADAPGHYSTTYGLGRTRFDFKDGVGIADPGTQNNACTLLRLGLWIEPHPVHWLTDLRIGTNLNGPILGISNLSPPLTPVPAGWFFGSGIPLVACPIPGNPGTLWLVWSGMNWHTAEDSMLTEIHLCTQQSQTNGCFPLPGSETVYASACEWETASWTVDYNDFKGKEIAGQPYDPLHLKSDAIDCNVHHSHRYPYIATFAVNHASQDSETWDRIKAEAVVHGGDGFGTSYIVVCWEIDYFDLDYPDAGIQTAQTHDWTLVLDIYDDGPTNWAAAILNHLGPFDTDGLPAPIGNGIGTYALQGIHSLSSTDAGQNGFGPCMSGPVEETKKPSPII